VSTLQATLLHEQPERAKRIDRLAGLGLPVLFLLLIGLSVMWYPPGPPRPLNEGRPGASWREASFPANAPAGEFRLTRDVAEPRPACVRLGHRRCSRPSRQRRT